MIKFLLFSLLVISLLPCISGYTNYVSFEKPFINHKINCPENYSINQERLLAQPKTIQPFGYTPNKYLDKTRFVITDIPLPTNPDFFI